MMTKIQEDIKIIRTGHNLQFANNTLIKLKLAKLKPKANSVIYELKRFVSSKPIVQFTEQKASLCSVTAESADKTT